MKHRPQTPRRTLFSVDIAGTKCYNNWDFQESIIMNTFPELIVMLTYNDCTVENAPSVFEDCRHSKAKYWGFKEKPLPLDEMKALFSRMKEYGKMTLLEVVAYDEETCLEGAHMAAECGTDFLVGTKYFDSVNDFCKAHNLKYMPFVGTVRDRPSVLEGSIDDMIAEAKECLAKGVYGIDLLGYRYTGDPVELIRRFVQEVDAPVCVAGSVNSFKRLDELKDISPWACTIGSAFFDHRFGDTVAEQIDTVCDYMQQ